MKCTQVWFNYSDPYIIFQSWINTRHVGMCRKCMHDADKINIRIKGDIKNSISHINQKTN